MKFSPLTFLLAVFRASRFTLHVLYGLFLAIFYPSWNIERQQRILQKWSAKLIRILNVRVNLAGEVSLRDVKNGLIVANHISWLDVYVMNSVLPLRFVAKAEVREWPVIGWLCERAQTIFIERNKRSDTIRTNMQAVEWLQRGGCIAIFPEGTSTDGTHVKHFHSSLLQPAVDAQVPVYPVAVQYRNKDGKLNTDAAYIGEMTFIQSLWKILCSRDLNAHLVTSPALDSQTENRRNLAQEAYKYISQAISFEHSAHQYAADVKVPDSCEVNSPSECKPFDAAPILNTSSRSH